MKIETNNSKDKFDSLVFKFLMNKYHFKKRLVNLENKEIMKNEISNLLKQAEIESDAVVCFMDMSYTLKYASPAHDTLYGIKEIDETNEFNVHPDDVPMLIDAIQTHSHNKKVCIFTFRYMGKHNDFVKVRSKFYPVFDENDVPQAYFTVSNLANENDEIGVVVL